MERQAVPLVEEVAGPPPSEGLRPPPPPLHGGPLALLRFMRRHRMVSFKYARLIVRLLRRRYLTPYGRRIHTDGLAFIGPRVVIEIGKTGRLELGRWSWIGPLCGGPDRIARIAAERA